MLRHYTGTTGTCWSTEGQTETCILQYSPEERSPQIAHMRFWDSIGPEPPRDFRPNGGLTSSELLTACNADTDIEEFICNTEQRWWEKVIKYTMCRGAIQLLYDIRWPLNVSHLRDAAGSIAHRRGAGNAGRTDGWADGWQWRIYRADRATDGWCGGRYGVHRCVLHWPIERRRMICDLESRI